MSREAMLALAHQLELLPNERGKLSCSDFHCFDLQSVPTAIVIPNLGRAYSTAT